MRAYELSAANGDGSAITLVTTDTAAEALRKYRGALERYKRAWVTDENGTDIDIDELIALAQEEARHA